MVNYHFDLRLILHISIKKRYKTLGSWSIYKINVRYKYIKRN
jgi:hypothetical protein